MRYEELQGVRIPKIGFGTWNIGGGMSPEPARDAEWLAALRSAIELGYTHFDTAESYADGHCEELLGRAIREAGAERSKLFLTTKVRPANLGTADVLRACDRSLRRLGTDYVDLYLIHWPSVSIPLEESFEPLNQLVEVGKVRRLGVSNFELPLLKGAVKLAATPLLTNQVPYSLGDRTYARNGVLDYCQSEDILLTAYSPLKHGGKHADAELTAIAMRHGLTPQQLALAWLCSQPRVITIPMSMNSARQRANLAAADIVLSPTELAGIRA